MTHWERVALPVLRALATSDNHHLKDGIFMVGTGRGPETLGLDIEEGELFEALFQLRDLGYLAFGKPQYESSPGAIFSDMRVTGRGLQVLGEWPRFEALVSPATLAEVVERVAEFAPDEEQKARWQKAAAYLRARSAGALKSTAVGVGAQIVRAGLGLP